MIDRGIREFIEKEVPRENLRFDEPMKGHTSLRIGGLADVFVTADDPDTVVSFLALSQRFEFPVLPVGGGTNLLVSDRGVEGAVLSLASLRALDTLSEASREIVVRVGAGLPLQELVSFCRKNGLSGIEGLAGVPGQVGGAITGNAGSYGSEMKDVLVKLTIAGAGGETKVLDKGDVVFGYRYAGLPSGSVVVSADLRFAKENPEGVAERMKQHLERKKKAQPLGQRSAGCVFKNPEGESAGRLIDLAGCKGMKEGGVAVSEVHAGFFINSGEGTSEDFLRLMDKVLAKVKEAFGITLETEIRIVGRC